MSQASLEHGLQLQNLHGVMFIVFVTGPDNGAPLLGILNQVIPMLIFHQGPQMSEDEEAVLGPCNGDIQSLQTCQKSD